MARFDVYSRISGGPVLLLDVQSDILQILDTRIVVPLAPQQTFKTQPLLRRLNPIVTVEALPYVLVTTGLGAARIVDLGTPIGNVEKQRQTVIDAIDFLLQGF